MSFSPFGQLAGDSTSEPPTPLDSALEHYSPWDTIEHDHEHQPQHQQQQQHSQHQSQEQHPQHASPILPVPIRTIQLDNRHSLEISGPTPSPDGLGMVDTTPIPLHFPLHNTRSDEGRLEMPENEAQMYTLVDPWASSSSVSEMAPGPPQPSASGLRRSARAHPARSMPYSYPRPQQSVAHGSGRRTTSTAAAGPSSRVDTGKYKETQPQQRFRFVNVRVPTSQSGASSAMPSPASTSGGRLLGQGSIAGSPVATPSSLPQSIVQQTSPMILSHVPAITSSPLSVQQAQQQQQIIPTPHQHQHQQQQQQQQQQQRQKYMIRTDGSYQPETGILTLMLELPGVERRDVRVTLATARSTRVRYLKVHGVVNPVLPPPKLEDSTLYPETLFRERKFGEFSRSFVVPPQLKREDVVATLKKGILTLNVHLGPPLEGQDVQEIPVN